MLISDTDLVTTYWVCWLFLYTSSSFLHVISFEDLNLPNKRTLTAILQYERYDVLHHLCLRHGWFNW